MISSAQDRIGGSVAAFLAERSPLDPGLPLHVRVGVLYSLVKRGNPGDVPQKLLQDPSTPELLRLHAAILLSEAGNFSAVQFLLQAYYRSSDASAAEQALRNCDRFPLAVLAAMALAPPLPIEELDLPDELVCTTKDPSALLKGLCTRPTIPGRGLRVGVVINRPLQFDNGFRHTGFIITEDAPPQIVAFDMGDLLNRDSASLVWPGAVVLTAYSEGEDQKALLVYVTGKKKEPAELTELYSLAAIEAKGVELGVVAATELGGKKKGCRIITAEGQNLYQHNTRVMPGNICILHPMNGTRPFFLFRAGIPVEARRKVFRRFRECTELDYGVRVRGFTTKGKSEYHEIITRKGEDYNLPGAGSPRTPVYLEHRGDGRPYHFVLPNDVMEDDDCASIILAWLSRNKGFWGASLPVPGTREGTSGLSVRAADGYVAKQSFLPGSLLRFTTEKGERVYTQDLEFRLLPGCKYCLGVGIAPCISCNATGWVVCPECDGSSQVACSDCSATGKETCGECKGNRTVWETCPLCKGLPQLFVGNLDYDIDDDILEDTFSEYGEIIKAIVLRNDEGSSRGVGFVTFADSEDAEIALEEMDGVELEGRNIKVNIASCKKCQGTKGKWVDCKKCDSNGRWKCGTCHGSGKTTCGCRRGQIVCTTCQGRLVVPCDCGSTLLRISSRQEG